MDQKSIREQTIKVAKGNLILDAARTIFAEKGFHDTRLEDIASAAGFSKASLYNYYSDKEEIFLSLAARDFNDLCKKMEAAINTRDTFFTNLERLLHASLAYFGEQFAFLISTSNFQVMRPFHSDQLIDLHKALSKKFCHHYLEIEQLHVQLIEKAQQKGEVSNALPAATITHFIGSLVRGIIIRWKLNGVMGDVPKEVGNLITFIRQGIAPPHDLSPWKSDTTANETKQE